jgi:hypothetical protein
MTEAADGATCSIIRLSSIIGSESPTSSSYQPWFCRTRLSRNMVRRLSSRSAAMFKRCLR